MRILGVLLNYISEYKNFVQVSIAYCWEPALVGEWTLIGRGSFQSLFCDCLFLLISSVFFIFLQYSTGHKACCMWTVTQHQTATICMQNNTNIKGTWRCKFCREMKLKESKSQACSAKTPGFLKILQQVCIQNLSILRVSVDNFLTPEGTFKDVPEDFDVPNSLYLPSGLQQYSASIPRQLPPCCEG